MNYLIIFTILCLSFINTQLAYATAQPSIGPLPPQTNGTPLNTERSYVQGNVPSTVMNDIPGFLKDYNNNYCYASNNTAVSQGAPCFVQYIVHQGTTAGYPYIIDNNSLQCPDNYVVAISLGNSALDPNNPNDKIYYYASNEYYKVSPSQYNVFHNVGNCRQGDVYNNGQPYYKCNWSDCSWNLGTSTGVYSSAVDSSYEIYATSSIGSSRPTFNVKPARCSFDNSDDTFGTCSTTAWCSHCDWYNYYFFYVNCTIPAGFYLYDPTNSNANNYDSSHIPSTIICVKPTIKWISTPITSDSTPQQATPQQPSPQQATPPQPVIPTMPTIPGLRGFGF